MANVKEWCRDLAGADQTVAYRARRQLDMACAAAGAKGSEAARAALAKELADELVAMTETQGPRNQVQKRPTHPGPVREVLCRALSLVGGASEAAALATALEDFDVRDAARGALERIGGEAGAAALVASLKASAGPEYLTGVINSLARLNGSDVTAALRAAVRQGDRDVKLAAVEALADRADAGNDAVIAGALGKQPASGRAVNRIARARIRLAQGLVQAGQKDAGRTILRAVSETELYAEPHRKTASRLLEAIG